MKRPGMRPGPVQGLSMVYGGPSMPRQPKKAAEKLEALSREKTQKKADESIQAPLPDQVQSDTDRPPPDEYERRRLRVTSRVDENGLLFVKVYVDGELVSESSSDGATVNVETDI